MATGTADRIRDSVRRAQHKSIALSNDVYQQFQDEFDRGPKHPRLRARAGDDFGFFCKRYGARVFTLPWADYHLSTIDTIQTAVTRGGKYAFAVPRGGGKTILCHWAVLWAILYGYSDYVIFVASTQQTADRRLENLKSELRFNDLLADDFPEVCIPIRHAAGKSLKARVQTFDGTPTGLDWRKSQIVMPQIDLSYAKCNGAVVDVAGIESGLRGRSFLRKDGTVVRPSLVIPDDPQTRESAKSPVQCEFRESVLAGDIMYLTSPTRPLGCLMPCTVIYENDLADRLLNRQRYPDWHGQRTKMVLSFPVNERMWEEYRVIRDESFRSGENGEPATEFYAANQESMDEGSEVSWPERVFEGDISAIQTAQNLKFDDESAFWAECQNEPLVRHQESADLVSPEILATKLNGLSRGVLPGNSIRMTAFIDISKKVLWPMVCAWEEGFSGSIVDCDVFPKQQTDYITLDTAKRTMQKMYPGGGFESALLRSLETLIDELMSREWKREGGGTSMIDLCLIDANWGQSTTIVTNVCKRSSHRGKLVASFGRGITASSKPLNDVKGRPKHGERRGMHWREIRDKEGHRVTFDTNFWKSFANNRLIVPRGDAGCISIYDDTPARHRMMFDQICSEYFIPTEGRGRKLDEWKIKPDRSDNHDWDDIVGNCVAASMLGISMDGMTPAHGQRKKRVSFASRR